MPKVALVTGASQGIGKAIAFRLSQDGFQVAVSDLPSLRDSLEEVRTALSTPSAEAYIYLADVSLENEVQSMVTEVVKAMGSLDVMVANAGIIRPMKPITEVTEEDFQRTMSVNLMGVFFCYKHAAQQMIKQGRGGRMIAASSVAGETRCLKQNAPVDGIPLTADYTASKFAVRGLTQTAALDLGKYGITVNAYAPGPVDTPMTRSLPHGLASVSEMISRSAIGRFAAPEEIAALVSYLASDAAGLVTGQTISINGGVFFD